jgi:hypothetical protein
VAVVAELRVLYEAVGWRPEVIAELYARNEVTPLPVAGDRRPRAAGEDLQRPAAPAGDPAGGLAEVLLRRDPLRWLEVTELTRRAGAEQATAVVGLHEVGGPRPCPPDCPACAVGETIHTRLRWCVPDCLACTVEDLIVAVRGYVAYRAAVEYTAAAAPGPPGTTPWSPARFMAVTDRLRCEEAEQARAQRAQAERDQATGARVPAGTDRVNIRSMSSEDADGHPSGKASGGAGEEVGLPVGSAGGFWSDRQSGRRDLRLDLAAMAVRAHLDRLIAMPGVGNRPGLLAHLVAGLALRADDEHGRAGDMVIQADELRWAELAALSGRVEPMLAADGHAPDAHPDCLGCELAATIARIRGHRPST